VKFGAALPRFLGLSFVSLAAVGCTTTFVAPPDPTPVLGAQLLSSVGGCADVRDGVTADGTPIILLDSEGGAGTDLTPLILSECRRTPSQQWTIR
jgi:hypothetical protein